MARSFNQTAKIFFKKKSNIILGGDFNIIPSAEDVYNVKEF